ncbi:hypothetical protein ND926_19435 [Vibrio diabolicus]|uniref:hypothetical protein n=1 Tax=Vibrio diabolicus TaxID=50719 RepID=UPI002160CDE1|nr:hypothetical protein [Vibrio diabolicus]MCR9567092.1 hypothetical protein [Vibrio alginolyticus]MCS0339632.1 hypothetical protein [Vibrio diabolicus]
MEISAKSALSTGKGIYDLLSYSYQNRQRKRVETFMKCVELRYNHMSPADQTVLNEYIASDIGQDILAEFADSITQTSSKTVQMALALLYCKDTEHEFSDSERRVFVSAMIGMTDDLLNFFLEVITLELQAAVPYRRAGIHSDNIEKFSLQGWDEEAVYVYINDLIRTHILLPDPVTSSGYHDPDKWGLWFGITTRTLKMARLLEKAKVLAE